MSMAKDHENQNVDPLVEVLSKPEIQSSIVTALEKLPGIMEKYEAFDRLLTFANAVVKDQESMDYLLEGLKADLPPMHLGRETLESAVVFIDKLPKIAKYMTAMERLLDTAESIFSDEQSLDNLFDGARELMAPWQDKLHDGVSLVQEARKRASDDKTPVTLFALMKWIKDPSVQRGLHFLKAFLSLLGERDTNKSTELSFVHGMGEKVTTHM